jgi:hypothetical protein
MPIVARGGVVYDLYKKQSSIDFVYIFPLKSKYSDMTLALIYVRVTAYKIAQYCTALTKGIVVFTIRKTVVYTNRGTFYRSVPL